MKHKWDQEKKNNFWGQKSKRTNKDKFQVAATLCLFPFRKGQLINYVEMTALGGKTSVNQSKISFNIKSKTT